MIGDFRGRVGSEAKDVLEDSPSGFDVPRFEPQTSRSRDERVTARPTRRSRKKRY